MLSSNICRACNQQFEIIQKFKKCLLQKQKILLQLFETRLEGSYVDENLQEIVDQDCLKDCNDIGNFEIKQEESISVDSTVNLLISLNNCSARSKKVKKQRSSSVVVYDDTSNE